MADARALLPFERVRDVVDAIATDLAAQPEREVFATVLFAYLARATSADELAAVDDEVSAISERIATTPLPFTLFGGIPGIGWLRTHLHLDDESDAELEQQVAASLRKGWAGDFDLIQGLVGIGVYALERRARGSQSDLLDVVVERLHACAEVTDTHAVWRTEPRFLTDDVRREFPDGWRNLGVAHGIAGVIAVLGAATRVGVAGARPLLDRAVAYLLSRRLPDGGPARFGATSDDRTPTRAGWCYGDPGIAIALFGAARNVGELEWEREALDIARIAARRSADDCGVVDTCLCHGTAGLGHIFSRLYRATEEPVFRTTAIDWFERTLAHRHEGTGIGGYQSWFGGWFDNGTFLAGAAGTGLALLAAATDSDPSWDRLLLCSTAA
jgi:hypothetical protein